MSRKLQVTIDDDIEHEVAMALVSKVLREYDNAKPKHQFTIWSAGDVNATVWRNKTSVSVYIWRSGQ